ncbi:MAG: hypothetical protein IKA79_06570 [Lentisphaeria bacterium]|nr:hypothetical protein [Lentisphaeria bacterium]
MTDYERSVIRDVPVVQLLEKDETNGSLRFKLTGSKESEVKVYEIRNTISRYTPYQGWRELYEVPMGLVLLPVAICSHVLNIVTIGIFPYSWCRSLDAYGLAALNPFLNNESESRFEEEPFRSHRDLVDTKNESISYILHHTDVMFKIGDKSKHKLTDDTGVVSFDLIDIKGMGLSLDNDDREFKVYVGSSAVPSYTWVIPRALQSRLMRVRAQIKAYEKNPTPANLYKAVTKLEELQFSKLSYQLEKTELKKRGQKFAKEFSEY